MSEEVNPQARKNLIEVTDRPQLSGGGESAVPERGDSRAEFNAALRNSISHDVRERVEESLAGFQLQSRETGDSTRPALTFKDLKEKDYENQPNNPKEVKEDDEKDKREKAESEKQVKEYREKREEEKAHQSDGHTGASAAAFDALVSRLTNSLSSLRG